ncbi:MAG: hypothetical protein ACPGWR_31915 [Ardenticatenaceae bacterium]
MRIYIAQILLLIVAVFIFYLGLGAGLIYDPTLGTLLWLLAGLIFLADAIWFIRTRSGPDDQ